MKRGATVVSLLLCNKRWFGSFYTKILAKLSGAARRLMEMGLSLHSWMHPHVFTTDQSQTAIHLSPASHSPDVPRCLRTVLRSNKPVVDLPPHPRPIAGVYTILSRVWSNGAM